MARGDARIRLALVQVSHPASTGTLLHGTGRFPAVQYSSHSRSAPASRLTAATCRRQPGITMMDTLCCWPRTAGCQRLDIAKAALALVQFEHKMVR